MTKRVLLVAKELLEEVQGLRVVADENDLVVCLGSNAM